MLESQSLEECLDAIEQVTGVGGAEQVASVGGAERGDWVEVGAARAGAEAGRSGKGRHRRFHASGDDFVMCLEAIDDYKCV
jgi:hypothetical protein